ncbi:MAG: ribosome maturation factor RimM [Propionibacteriaceae bacterium]|jgi:16S rRNA processing protein RimM|nr:ribosome maturation factor RimM [Propionibacteriaceae bacterium]
MIDVCVGKLGRAHGLSGELFVDLRTDSPEQRFRVGAVVQAGSRALTVKRFRRHGERFVVAFSEVRDRTSAEQLIGAELFVQVDEAESPADSAEYYDHQLHGLTVEDALGVVVGKVIRVEHFEFQDLLVVETPSGDRYVPFVNDLVPEVDLAERRLVVKAIPGLLEDE